MGPGFRGSLSAFPCGPPLGSSWLLTSNPATGGSFTDQLCAFVAPGQAGPCSLKQVGWSKECTDTQLGEPGKLSYLPQERRCRPGFLQSRVSQGREPG